MKPIILALLLALAVTYKPVIRPADVTITGIELGYVKLTNSDNSGLQTYEHKFDQPFKAAPTIAPGKTLLIQPSLHSV